MLDFLPAPVRGVIASLLLALNTILLCSFLFCVALVKALPFAFTQRIAGWLMSHTHEAWISNNKGWMNLVRRTRWHVSGLQGLDYQHSYLITSNHQSWVDILVLQYVLNRKIQPLKFFLKQELIWVPVIGLAWWALGFPFMKRYSKAYLEKHPEKKGKDLETTRKACERYKNQPVLILNFLEGTRFTPAKHAQQKSPYRHLLKPKAGGFAFTLGALGEKLNSLLDVTIVYPEGAKGFWDFLAGRVHHVVVEVRQLTIPHELYAGNYENDAEFRARFQAWIAQLWAEKDARIGAMLARST